MLSNQRFVDPELAKNISLLEKQMKSLLAQKLQIQYNTKFMEPKRREEMLKSNEEQRVSLRKIIEKSKLSMVEYFDKQVQVVSIDCVKNGSVVQKAEQSFCINEIMERKYHRENEQSQELDIKKQKSFSLQSKNSQSTNHKSHINKVNDQSMNVMGFQSQNSADSFIDPQNPKLRKSCLSTHYRINSIGFRGTGNSRQKESSEVLNGSLIEKKYNSSDIMEINEFNVTSNSFIPPLIINQSDQEMPYPNAKSTLLSYLQQEPFSQELEDISQLYNKKIFWLEKKCLQLQSKNSQMIEVIHYQEKTIEDLQSFINQKDQQIAHLQISSKQKQQSYQQKFFQLQHDLKQILEVIEKNKQKITLNLQANQIISKYRLNYNLPNHLPLTYQSFNDPETRLSSFYFSHQQRSYVQNFNVQPQISPSQTEKNQIIYLGRQLVELQTKLKQIQDQNEQLKGERKLLLKKVKI